MRLSWQPVSNWIPMDRWPRIIFSTRGIDLSDPTLETEMVGSSSLCLQVKQLKGYPFWEHFLGKILLVPSQKADLQWKSIWWLQQQLGQTLVLSTVLIISAELSFLTPHFQLRWKWSDSKPLMEQRGQGLRGLSWLFRAGMCDFLSCFLV